MSILQRILGLLPRLYQVPAFELKCTISLSEEPGQMVTGGGAQHIPRSAS